MAIHTGTVRALEHASYVAESNHETMQWQAHGGVRRIHRVQGVLESNRSYGALDGSKTSVIRCQDYIWPSMGPQGHRIALPRYALCSGVDIRAAYIYLVQSFPVFMACMDELENEHIITTRS